jgi:hypothetical protein
MASQTDILNLAMRKIGGPHITAIDDGTEAANVLKDIYTSCLEAELASHPWAFATTRAMIPADAVAPAFGWNASYPLPVGYLKMVEVGEWWVFYRADCGPRFTIEGRAVLTDAASPLKIRYVQRMTNAGAFPPGFVQSFACRLGAESAEALTQNLSKRQAAWDERKVAIREAKRTNDIELPPQVGLMYSWELANRGIGG